MIGADYVGVLREVIEREVSGTAMFLAAAVGGMQTAWDGVLPAVDDDGTPIYEANGDRTFVRGGGYAYARTAGTLIARASLDTPLEDTPWDRLSVQAAPLVLPITNVGFEVALRTSLLDQPWDSLVRDSRTPRLRPCVTSSTASSAP